MTITVADALRHLPLRFINKHSSPQADFTATLTATNQLGKKIMPENGFGKNKEDMFVILSLRSMTCIL